MDSDRNISTLKSELNKADKTKEEAFSQSKDNRNKIQEKRKLVSQLKSERNNLTDSVKKLKVERDVLNKELQQKISEFKKLVPKRKKADPKANKVNVNFVKKEIAAMEYKIETEGLSFDKEQKLMKIINQKKKEIEGASGGPIPEEARKISKEIDTIRAKADEVHKQIQVKADESQKKHEAMIVASNELKDLDKKQKEIEVKIREYKGQVGKINEELYKKLETAVTEAKNRPIQEAPRREFRKDKDYKKGNNDERKDDRKHANIQELQHKAEEKLKKGQKITTEDLLAFQNRR